MCSTLAETGETLASIPWTFIWPSSISFSLSSPLDSKNLSMVVFPLKLALSSCKPEKDAETVPSVETFPLVMTKSNLSPIVSLING